MRGDLPSLPGKWAATATCPSSVTSGGDSSPNGGSLGAQRPSGNDVASAYHRFYNACRILDAEGTVQQGRIALCLAVRGVIHNILTMFKVNAPETM